jgi:hypothetical protein
VTQNQASAGCYPDSVSAPTEKAVSHTLPGLCADCIHARRIESDRGSVFFLCQLAQTDDRFKKYPRLPVLSCIGYERKVAPNV